MEKLTNEQLKEVNGGGARDWGETVGDKAKQLRNFVKDVGDALPI